MFVSRNSQTLGEKTMSGFDEETLVALDVALDLYDKAAEDNVTAPAAYGVACLVIQDLLHVNLRAAALLLDVALTQRRSS